MQRPASIAHVPPAVSLAVAVEDLGPASVANAIAVDPVSGRERSIAEVAHDKEFVDIVPAMEGKDPGADVLLAPYDVIYVPRDRLSNASLVLERIRNAVPFSVNYGYYLNSPTP